MTEIELRQRTKDFAKRVRRLLAREIARLLPDDPAAARLVKEADAPRPRTDHSHAALWPSAGSYLWPNVQDEPRPLGAVGSGAFLIPTGWASLSFCRCHFCHRLRNHPPLPVLLDRDPCEFRRSVRSEVDDEGNVLMHDNSVVNHFEWSDLLAQDSIDERSSIDGNPG